MKHGECQGIVFVLLRLCAECLLLHGGFVKNSLHNLFYSVYDLVVIRVSSSYERLAAPRLASVGDKLANGAFFDRWDY